MRRLHTTSTSLLRNVPGILTAALLLPWGGVAIALDVGKEVCAEVDAYAAKLGKAERSRREEEARQDAKMKLARRVWARAFRGSGDPAKEAFESLRFRYRVLERLDGGTYRADGDKTEKQIAYCIREDQYGLVQRELLREREEKVKAVRARFSQLELQVAEGNLGAASRTWADLKIEVVGEVLELAEYESALDGRTRPFYVWLFEWGDAVVRGPEFARSMLDRAQDLVERGRIEEADRYVAEALEGDRDNADARELRHEIQESRNRRVSLMDEAEKLAEAGRFKAARRKLDEAAAIGNDDPLPLETTAGAIDAMHAEYLQYNPARTVLLYTAFGNLGVDTGAIEDRVQEATGITPDGSLTLSFGAGGNFRLGRFALLGVSGSWGVTQDDNNILADAPVELYELYQLTAGVGYRTRRNERSKFSFQVIGGPALEYVNVQTLTDNSADSSDSQLAFFVRFAAEMPSAYFFIQHGLGFEDSGNSLVAWSNNFQLGAAIVF